MNRLGNPIRMAAESVHGEVKAARNGALYFAPGTGALIELTAADVCAFERWAHVEPSGLGSDLTRLHNREITQPELALLTLGIKQMELGVSQDTWLAYDKKLRQLAAQCLREKRGGGALYACWAAMRLATEEEQK